MFKDTPEGQTHSNCFKHTGQECCECSPKDDCEWGRMRSNSLKSQLCKNCGGDISIRNPKGNCDHLYYPENIGNSLKSQLIEEAREKYLKTKFSRGGGSAFECADFEGMDSELANLIDTLISDTVDKTIEAAGQNIEDYFEGLIFISYPNATKDLIKNSLNSLKE